MLEIRDEAPAAKPGTAETAEQKAQRAVIYATLDARLNAIRGVRAASVSWLGLFSANDRSLNVIDADQPNNRGEARVDFVSPRYFETVGMQLVRGRGLSDRDREGTERIAVVNEAMARVRFNGDALGHRLTLDYAGERDRPFTVVGIVRDAKYNSLRETRTKPMMWAALAQAPFRISSVALRTEPGAEAAVLREAEAVLKATNGDLMVRRTTTLAAEVDQNDGAGAPAHAHCHRALRRSRSSSRRSVCMARSATRCGAAPEKSGCAWRAAPLARPCCAWCSAMP